VIDINTLFVINPVFQTGEIVATRGVYDLGYQDAAFARFVQKSLNRHVKVTGETCRRGQEENELSLKEGFRLLSGLMRMRGYLKIG
jgi:hypothetical protein